MRPTWAAFLSRLGNLMSVLVLRPAFVTLAAALATLACAGKTPEPVPPPEAPAPAPTPEPVPPPLPPVPEPAPGVERVLKAAELDPAADQFPAPQYAYLDPAARPLQRLVVYLVGKGNPPQRGRAMGAWLASQGFHVVVPGYANDYDIRQLCEAADVPDADCHSKLRMEAFEGVDHSPHIQISRPNSLEARVGRMLERLNKDEPTAGWGRFSARALPRWEEVIVAGHSHGASSSAFIGKIRRVQRVVMLSGPFDNRAGEPATWTRRRSLTPADRYFGFSHAREEQYPGHIKNWGALGLAALGPLLVLEQAPTPTKKPFAGTHQVVTSLAAEGDNNPHGMTTAGKASPRQPDGGYHYAPVWRYLFGLN